jgi:DNA topoisomerase-2
MSKQKYQLLKPVQHVLHRPDMYIGSVITEESMKRWVCEDDKVLEKVVNYNPGFLKLFDEIISNSADEHKRNSKLNSIKVEIDSKAGTISIWDNGGIPVKKHETYDGYIPEMIFSEMFSGSNFDDTEERTTVGTNGLGSVLTNIYSHEFKIETCDGSKTYSQVFEKNMSIKGTPEIKTGKRGFTRITYTPDLGRFEMDSIDNDHILQLRKRALDIAASNSGLSVEFIADGSFNTYKFKDFKEYIDFYLDEFTECFYLNNKRADIAIVSSDSGFYHKSFVNSVDTFGGGTHIKQLENQVIEYTREYIKKKSKYDIKPSDVRNHFGIFVNCLVTNPRFKGQTKEILSTASKDLGCDLTIPEKVLKQIVKSEITSSIMDWVEKKVAADEKAEMRKLNKKIGGALPINLLDAKTNKRQEANLYIMEGKCLANETKVIVKDNEVIIKRQIKDLQVGDLVYTHNNTWEPVIAKDSSNKEVYEISYHDKVIKCSANHLWLVNNLETNINVIIKTDELDNTIHRLIQIIDFMS